MRVLTSSLWNRGAAGASRALLRDFKPDVVHLHKLYPQLSVAPVRVFAAAGLPIVQTVHDYEFIGASHTDHNGRWFDRDESRLRYTALNSLLYPIKRFCHAPCVTSWIAVSGATADAYSHAGMDAVVLPNFPDRWDRSPDRPAFERRQGVLFVGRLAEEKGVRDVLSVAERLPDLTVTMAGGGPLEATVRDAARQMANLDYVGVVDRVKLRRLLCAARLVVMPSHWEEPGPLTALEAMEAGTPVVCYPRGGLAEYVGGAHAGRVVEEDAAALASACAELLSDQQAWRAMSTAGLNAIAHRHNADVYVDRLLEQYEGAIARVAGATAP